MSIVKAYHWNIATHLKSKSKTDEMQRDLQMFFKEIKNQLEQQDCNGALDQATLLELSNLGFQPAVG